MSKMYVPLAANITVKLPELNQKTKGGIIKDDAMLAEERSKFTGAVTVAHCGPQVPVNPVTGHPQIQVGDKVLLRNAANLSEITVFGETVHQVDCYSVLGVLKS